MESAIKIQMTKLKRMQFNINKGDKYLKEVQKLKELAETCSVEDKKALGDEILKHLDKSLSDMKMALIAYKSNQSASTITINGHSYNMKDYATISQYAKLFGYKSVQAVSNKISRGSIPAQDVVHIPELDVKLIRLP